MREQEVSKKDLLFVYDASVVKAMKQEGISYLCSAIAHGSGKKFWLYPRSERTENVMLSQSK